ncbi:MAG: RNA 2',3'-cyclic phosphodiesterase [Planctomycetota bacterium]
MGQIRTFIAVDVSSAIKNSAAKVIHRLSADAVDFNWVEKENLHITLNFLGDVEEAEVPAVCRLVEKTVTDFGSFELEVRGLGCFPKPEKPRVMWMGVEAGGRELIELNGRLAEALETMRFPRERNDYRPHLTLGRIRRGGRWSPVLSEAVNDGYKVPGGSMIVNQVVVYSSYLDRIGPTYTAMSRIDLA